MASKRCPKCGGRQITYIVGGTIPWIVCPVCDKEAIKESGVLRREDDNTRTR